MKTKSQHIEEEIQHVACECSVPPTSWQKECLRELSQMLKKARANEKGPRGEPLDPSAT